MWIYKAKPDKHGLLARVKARLVADGSREQGLLPDGDVYTPVMMMTTVRAMLIICLQHIDCRFWQLDVENAYATADCTRDIYVHFPQGRKHAQGSHMILKLRKALYGVVDSGRTFYEEWLDYHLALGFQPIHHDKCYLLKFIDANNWIRICFHVDDNIIAQTGEPLWLWYHNELKRKYVCKCDPLTYCMGIEFAIDYDTGILTMTQTAQIEKMLRELDLTRMKGSSYPNESSAQPDLSMIETPTKAILEFPMLKYLGHLNCLQQCTRPDITRPLKIASKFGNKFGSAHIHWVKHIVRYLIGTKSLGITFRRVAQDLRNFLQIFTDASHASDPDTRRSMSGVTIKLAGNLLLWKANFQKIVSHSSTESELMALDSGATLGQYTKWVCLSLGISPVLPIPLYVDNSSTIHIATNPIQPGRNVHVHARYFYVRDFVLSKEYVIVKIDTSDQISDVLVTFKSNATFIRFRSLLMNCSYVAVEDKTIRWFTTYIS
jgi:hypothetical protein